ncbi:MAG: hypothetical protein IRY85_22945, partial [Micromonosporaceae bacterium]|nr:hypothetical protein [Micromonosporaceae bacterium]
MFDPGVCDTVAPIVCSPLTAWLCEAECDAALGAGKAVDAAANVATMAPDLLRLIISFFTDPVGGAVKNFLIMMFSWLLIPTSRFFDTSDGSVSDTIQDSWILPIVLVLLACGTLWQGFRMVISRRGEPLIRVVKAFIVTAAAGGLATAGTAALLSAGDRYSCWVLGEALRGVDSDDPNELIVNGRCASDQAIQAVLDSQVVDRLADVLRVPAVFMITSGPGLILGTLLNLFVLAATFAQIFLLVIRGGSLVIVVGVLQLAAAGKITQTTSSWTGRAVGWVLALVFYKPAAATVYATALLLIDDAGNDSHAQISNFIMGLTMLLLALFAMPALMRFFTWGFSALGRDGSLAGAATGMDNLADDAIRIGNDLRSNAKKQASNINSSLAVVETRAGVAGSANAVGTGGGAAGIGGGGGGGGIA